MSNPSVETKFAELVASSSKNVAEKFAAKSKIIIQWSHCSASAGVERIAEELAAALPDTAVLVVSGCDGACFEAPVVTVGAVRYVRVTSDHISDIVRNLHESEHQTDASSQPFFSPQTRIALDGCGTLDAEHIDGYISHRGYAGLAESLSRTPEEVIVEV
jgi:(2Fe-2S) ferredoxin